MPSTATSCGRNQLIKWQLTRTVWTLQYKRQQLINSINGNVTNTPTLTHTAISGYFLCDTKLSRCTNNLAYQHHISVHLLQTKKSFCILFNIIPPHLPSNATHICHRTISASFHNQQVYNILVIQLATPLNSFVISAFDRHQEKIKIQATDTDN